MQSDFYATGTYKIAGFLAADFNQDGFDDFAITRCSWTDCTDSIYIYLNDHDWPFNKPQQYFVGTLNRFISYSADLNGDSFPDIYMKGYSENSTIKILWNNGDGTFSYLNPVGIKDSKPEESSFFEVNPNPFSSVTNINFNCSEISNVSVQIFDMHGVEIRSLINDQKKMKGNYQIKWDGTDNSVKDCKPGVYVVVLEMNEIKYSNKIIHY